MLRYPKCLKQVIGFTFDIESGYHHIDIHPCSRKFPDFSFVWPDGRVLYFVFNVLLYLLYYSLLLYFYQNVPAFCLPLA